jgi:hypothetical protein
VDQDEALTSLINLGLVEMLFTNEGPRYRIVKEFTGPNELLRARLGRDGG